jgi:GNAT superfamily N-acetyltransferase
MRSIEVDAVRPGDEDRAVETIALAFTGDAMARWMYPDPERYLACFPELVRALGGGAFACRTAYRAAGFQGAALWLPPGIRPDTDRLAGLVRRSVPADRREALCRCLEGTARSRPDLWRLALIGVEPQEQGKGYGSALMHHALARCDEERSGAYVECAGIEGVRFFRRHGFMVLASVGRGALPNRVAMLRMPARDMHPALPAEIPSEAAV